MAQVKSCKDVVKEPGPSQRPPSKKVKREEILNPCSGRYEGEDHGLSIEMMVDVDKLREFSKTLGVISGTLVSKNPTKSPWGRAASGYFIVIDGTVKVTGANTLQRDVTADIKVTFNDGTKSAGHLKAHFSLPQDDGTWNSRVELEIFDQKKIVFQNAQRKSLFFKDVHLDIDFTQKVIWPIVEFDKLTVQPPGMEDRKIDAFSAFEDAGLKLHYDEAHSEKVEDPSPHSPWTKGDLYEVMMHYFDEIENSDENIWCLMGDTPPDKRYMGFSFDKKGRTGFGLFTGHSVFSGLDSENARKKTDANRRLLHYLVHECGHCLGLKHPFEIGMPNSLSWMNYSWKFDLSHEPGNFYRDFRYCFSDKELIILRHSPGKEFRTSCEQGVLESVMGSGYSVKSEIPDAKLADDDSDNDDDDDEESDVGITSSKRVKSAKPKRMRKILLDLKFRKEPFAKGELLSFEARVKNVGKLPALIEGDLALESGNLSLYITAPDSTFQVVEPFVRPVQSGYSRPLVLYTTQDTEGSDRYSELVIVGEGKDGYQFHTPGEYSIRAVYTGGRYLVTSPVYKVEITDEVDVDEDGYTVAQVSVATTLGASSSSRFSKAQGYWKKLMAKPVEYKKRRVAVISSLMSCLSSEAKREPVHSGGKRLRRSKRQKSLAMAKGKAPFSPRQLLKDTADIVKYFQAEGLKEENLDYSKIVFARGALYIAENHAHEGDIEFNQMMADLVQRGVKYETLKAVSKKWNKMKNPTKPEDKTTPEYLQKKVNAVLTWAPSIDGNGEPDLSGVGLGMPFSNFLTEQLKKASKILDILFNMYEETKNLVAVISYADKLQKGREVNYMVLRWALEALIVHSMDAKRAGIKYPEPSDKDQSLQSDAAMIVTQRVGNPSEDWMAYWRCDADFNYHHRHFHMVYVVSQFIRPDRSGILDSTPGHLERQGELFGYMHTQLLARYDADRESWGLKPVQPWSYNEKTMSFNAGMEFHNDEQFWQYAPRPSTGWPTHRIKQFEDMEANYRNAMSTGIAVKGVEMSPNVAGHILEPSSGLYGQKYGSFHNAGHGIFGSTGVHPRATSYMNDTATAVRDTIFYRWHKKIDNLWQENNERFISEIGLDAPEVTITANDIIIDHKKSPPTGFEKWDYGNWAAAAPSEPSTINTCLGPPTKKYEWDNKLTHEAFYYHLRMKRNQGAASGDLNLTIRIFICPKNRESNRTKWIEMDKFVYNMPADVDHAVVTRADVHSSVIKRLPKHSVDDIERKFVRDAGGFCECGWPYSMLLPRGTSVGQEYTLCVIATDNNIDNIGFRTTCGSMSYCGARGEKYPDSRTMGYPFTAPIAVDGETIPIPGVFDKVTNAAYKSFTIKNNVCEPPPNKMADIWWPHMQLKVNDGTLRREPESGGISEFVQSDKVGTFRVLIDNEAAWPAVGDQIYLRFQGRGPRGGAYTIRDVKISLRKGNALNIVPEMSRPVTYKHQTQFTVPEDGLLSDGVTLRFHPGYGDYFVTFTLDSPGVYLPASQATQTSTFFIPSKPWYTAPIPDDWTNLWSKIETRTANIHCIAGIMTSIP